MKTAIVLILALFALGMSGCATFDSAQTLVAIKGAKTSDEMQQTAEWALCNGISIGAWRRAYATDPDKAEGWRKLCKQPDTSPVIVQ